MAAKIKAMRVLGVPYEAGYEDKKAYDDLARQAVEISKKIKEEKKELDVQPDREIVALIAYLQRLGTDIEVK